MLPYAFNPYSSSSVEAQRPAQPPPAPPPGSAPTLWRTLAAGAVRTLAIQTAAKTAGLAVFTGLAAVPGSASLAVLVGGLGALSGGSMAFLLGRHQIGAKSAAQKAAVALCTVTGCAAGGVVAVLGCWQPVATFAVGAVAISVASTVGKFTQAKGVKRSDIETAKAVSFCTATAATLVIASTSSTQWSVPDETLVARNFGAVFESVIIDASRATLEQCGPSSDRNALRFEGVVLSAAAGALPYVGASVVINGVIASFLQPPNDSHHFVDLLWPVLLSTIVNVIRDPTNSAAVVLLHNAGIGVAPGAAPVLRPHRGPQDGDVAKVAMKTAIRYILIICRNAIYLNMRQSGLSILQAACVAQTAYSLFAQNREILFDLMSGAGWTVPAHSAGIASPTLDASTMTSDAVDAMHESRFEGSSAESSTIVSAVDDSCRDSSSDDSGTGVGRSAPRSMQAAASTSECV